MTTINNERERKMNSSLSLLSQLALRLLPRRRSPLRSNLKFLIINLNVEADLVERFVLREVYELLVDVTCAR
jgi:hypothetical protein